MERGGYRQHHRPLHAVGFGDIDSALDREAIDHGATREIVIPFGSKKLHMQGANFLLHYALPNYYFHLVTAYDVLRYAGVEIGKRDFLGMVPGFVLV